MTAGKNNRILIVGVLMLGGYIYMKSKAAQAQYTGGQNQPQLAVNNMPQSMPASVGAGLAQAGVGALSNWLQSKFNGSVALTKEEEYGNAIMRSPYNLAEHLTPTIGLQDMADFGRGENFMGELWS